MQLVNNDPQALRRGAACFWLVALFFLYPAVARRSDPVVLGLSLALAAAFLLLGVAAWRRSGRVKLMGGPPRANRIAAFVTIAGWCAVGLYLMLSKNLAGGLAAFFAATVTSCAVAYGINHGRL